MKNLAEQLKGRVIMDVMTPEKAKIAEAAGGVSRMSDPKMIKNIQAAAGIPVMAKCRIGHIVEARLLGAECVFVGSGIFKSGAPQKPAGAIVKAAENFEDYALIARLSEDLGEAMVGINESEIEILMAQRNAT